MILCIVSHHQLTCQMGPGVMAPTKDANVDARGRGVVIAMDRLRIVPIAGVQTLQADFLIPETALGLEKFSSKPWSKPKTIQTEFHTSKYEFRVQVQGLTQTRPWLQVAWVWVQVAVWPPMKNLHL